MEKLSISQKIEMAKLMQDEWCHRDSIMWSHVYKLYIAALVVVCLPYIAGKFVFVKPERISWVMVECIGCAICICAMFIAVGLAKRQMPSGSAYSKLVCELDSEYKKKYDLLRKPWKLRLSSVLSLIMLGALFIFSVVSMVVLPCE